MKKTYYILLGLTASIMYIQTSVGVEGRNITYVAASTNGVDNLINEIEVESDLDEPEEPPYQSLYEEEVEINGDLRLNELSYIKEIHSLQKEINKLERQADIKPVTKFEVLKETPNIISEDQEVINFEEAYVLILNENEILIKATQKLKKTEKVLKEKVYELQAIIKEQERIAKLPFTLRTMEQYDYSNNSVTGLTSKKLSVSVLNKKLKAYGKLVGTGMPYKEYKETMNYQWTDHTDYKNKPDSISVDITKTINYKNYVNTLKKLSRYEGVYLYQIGKSGEGRDLYAIEIDFPSDKDKKVIMLTGQVHAREFAGGTFILKELVDLVQKAQTNKATRKLLEKVKYVAVPIVNVDGRENLITAPAKWTVNGQLWKAYSNGTDGNRNFPGLSWGEIAKGNRLNGNIAKKAGYANYPGAKGGSSSETKAMMKWLYHYVVVENADSLLDYHQQGSIVYADKPWLTKAQSKINVNFRGNILSFMNKGNWNRRYNIINESSTYSLDGTGSTITDYAMGLAVGAKFSPAYGFHVFTDGKKEYSLMQIKDIDKIKFKIKAPNSSFKTLTLEIGYGSKYLGNSAATRKLLATEYKSYHFDTLLENLPNKS